MRMVEALSGDGESTTSSFSDLQSALNGPSKLYIRFGGKVYNTSSTGLEMARASFRLDIRRC